VLFRSANAQQASAEAMVRFNRAKLDDARIAAPFSGVIVERSRNAGDVVTPGAEIARLVDPASIFLSARFDESAMGKVAPGQDVQLTFVSDPDTVVAGKVLRVGRQVDGETREFAVDIAPVSLPPNWAIGQRGTAAIAVAKRISVLSVPAPAIVWKDGEPGAWFVRHGRAVWRRLVLGEIAAGNRVVVHDGAAEGDLVVVRPVGIYSGLRIDAGESRP
jgi:HlyD family secretion protein